MHTPYRAAVAFAFAVLSLVGPVSAATSAETIAQASTAQGTISGTVLDQRGNPLAGATVVASGPGGNSTVTTDGSGRFSIPVAPGVYTLVVSRGGYNQSQSDPIPVVAGSGVKVSIALNETNLQSLRVIGRTSTTAAGRNAFNISESPVNVLPPALIALRENNNLTDTVATLPGVVVQRTFSATPNTNFVVRGAGLQTRVTLDGHPISSGIAGQWNTNYAVASIFQDVEVAKGAGLNGSIAGESAVGTVNVRTRDFTRNNTAGLEIGADSYSGGFYNAFADVNFLKDNRASLIVQKAFVGFNGPWNNNIKDRSGITNSSSLATGTNQVPSFIGLDQWTGDFSNRYSLEGELAKLRYRFSESSSITLEYLGLQGQYQPQGGSYAGYVGTMTLQACQEKGAFQATLATCTSQSTYTAPYTFGNIGNVVDAYTWFPNSYIQNNEPTFAAELRTTLKNDTILFRPYTHLINRYISGVNENHYPGNGGAWYAVTNAANCQPLFLAPGASGGPATGAAGPCFPSTLSPTSPSYVGASGPAVVFPTTNAAPVCSAAPPFTCFTTSTGFQNDGTVGYSSPFSQPELDRLNGYTFSYIHPMGDNVINFSFDYRKDLSQSQSSDTSAAASGCSFVIGNVSNVRSNSSPIQPGVANTIDNNGVPYQPGCSLANFGTKVATATPYAAYNMLPRSSIGTPPTVSQYSDLALTASLQATPKLRLTLGNYLEIYKLNAQIEDPAVLAAYAARGNSGAAPVALVPRGQTYTHYDPHAGFTFRATRDLSIRGTAGSSITQPYPSLVSGFGSITIPNAAQSNYVNSIPNFNLKPETTVAYDLGFDQRLADGGVLSMDIYDNTIHDVWLANTTNLGTIAGVCGPGANALFPNALCLQTNQINGPLQRSYGVELSLTKNPINGFGYFVSTTLNRSYLDQLPLSIYLSNTSATNGNFNVSGAQLFGNPFFKAYASISYGDARGDAFSLGADYEGPNNYTFGPAYTIWDAAGQFPIAKRARIKVSVQNLFNLNTGTLLGRSLANQGNIEPTLWYNSATGQLLPGNSTLYGRSNGPTNINALPPRTVRMSLNFAL